MTIEIISSGVDSGPITVGSGLQVEVQSGGEIYSATVSSGGIVDISAGGVVSAIVV